MKRLSLALLVLAAAPAGTPLAAQSLLYRGPNMGGTWVPDAGVVQFNFLHRFYVTPGPSHSVINYPTFTLAAGFGHGVAVGGRFATKSLVGTGAAAQSSNETELFARWRPLGAEGKPGFSVALTPAYNLLAKSVDGEVSVDWTRGALTLEGAGRGVTRELGTSGQRQLALAGGVVTRLTPYIAVGAGRIPAGATVVWVNDDVAEHTVTFDGTEPGSPMISPGGTFSHRFDRPGTYPYHCTPHPFMKGVVVVK